VPLPVAPKAPSRRSLLLLGLILAAGVSIRLTLAYVLLPVSGFYFDVPAFASWALSLAYHGPAPYYTTAGFADYPPGFLLILWPLGLLSLQIAPNDELTTRLLVKLPAILADCLLAAAVAWLGLRRAAGARAGLLAAALYILNPVTWFDSAVWGQVDSIGTLILFLTIVSLGAGRSELAALLAALAILTKPQYAIVAPIVGVVLLRKHLLQRGKSGVVLRQEAEESVRSGDGFFASLRMTLGRLPSLRLVTSLLAGAIPAYAVLSLFHQTPFEFIEHMRQTADQYPYVSMNAFNPWAIFALASGEETTHPLQAVPWLLDLLPITDGITPYQIGLTLFVLASVPVAIRLAMRQDQRTLWICASALALALFILPTRMHERYAFPFFALALPLAATSGRWLACYVILSLASFANIYAVYSLPLLNNAGSFRPEFLERTLFSTEGITALAVINTLGLFWVLWEALPLRATSFEQVEPQGRTPRWRGSLGRLPGWQGRQDLVGVGVQLTGRGKLLKSLRGLSPNLVRSSELKPRVGVSGGELDGTP
jgi:dolichyl-phosphate-mannose-protein mannosyltransferase